METGCLQWSPLPQPQPQEPLQKAGHPQSMARECSGGISQDSAHQTLADWILDSGVEGHSPLLPC